MAFGGYNHVTKEKEQEVLRLAGKVPRSKMSKMVNLSEFTIRQIINDATKKFEVTKTIEELRQSDRIEDILALAKTLAQAKVDSCTDSEERGYWVKVHRGIERLIFDVRDLD